MKANEKCGRFGLTFSFCFLLAIIVSCESGSKPSPEPPSRETVLADLQRRAAQSFAAMTPAQHLTAARNTIKADATLSDEGIRHLQAIPAGTSERREADRLLKDSKSKAEKLRAEAEKQRRMAEAGRITRALAAQRLEQELLGRGVDVQVAAVGPQNEQLIIRGRNVTRPFGHVFLRQPGMQSALKRAGFSTATFMNDSILSPVIEEFALAPTTPRPAAAPKSTPAASQFKAAKVDEVALVRERCGAPDRTYTKSGSTLPGHKLYGMIYQSYNTELIFQRSPQEKINLWTFSNAFPANGGDSLSSADVNRKMPCLKNALREPF